MAEAEPLRARPAGRRLGIAARTAEAGASDRPAAQREGAWSLAEQLAALAYTAALTAPAAFFWAPPLWVTALLLPRRAPPSS